MFTYITIARRLLLIIFICSPLYTVHAQSTPRVDIIIEADTYAPSFYAGRREPTAGSVMYATAVLDGISSSAYTYRWEINGSPQNDDATISFITPVGSSILVRVDVLDKTNTVVASEQRYVPVSQPHIELYSMNLLRGISTTAVQDHYILTSTEVELHAMPYFVSTPFKSRYAGFWIIDNQNNTLDNSDEWKLTLRHEEGSGTAKVHFKLNDLAGIQQYQSPPLTIQF